MTRDEVRLRILELAVGMAPDELGALAIAQSFAGYVFNKAILVQGISGAASIKPAKLKPIKAKRSR